MLEGLPFDKIDNNIETWLLTWAPDFKEYIASRKSSENACQDFCYVWIWHILFENLFSNDCLDKWKDGAWADFGSLLRNLQRKSDMPSAPRLSSHLPDHVLTGAFPPAHVEQRDNEFTFTFFSWKHSSVHMLHMLHDSHSDPSRLKNIIRPHFESLVPVEVLQSDMVEEMLSRLVEKAIEIDLLILAARWDIKIEMLDPETGKPHSFRFKENSDLMKESSMVQVARKPFHDRPVAFVCTPLLRSFGQSAGQHSDNHYSNYFSAFYVCNYEVYTVWHCMEVVLDPNEQDPKDNELGNQVAGETEGKGKADVKETDDSKVCDKKTRGRKPRNNKKK